MRKQHACTECTCTRSWSYEAAVACSLVGRQTVLPHQPHQPSDCVPPSNISSPVISHSASTRGTDWCCRSRFLAYLLTRAASTRCKAYIWTTPHLQPYQLLEQRTTASMYAHTRPWPPPRATNCSLSHYHHLSQHCTLTLSHQAPQPAQTQGMSPALLLVLPAATIPLFAALENLAQQPPLPPPGAAAGVASRRHRRRAVARR